jgi:hypothetical protein
MVVKNKYKWAAEPNRRVGVRREGWAVLAKETRSCDKHTRVIINKKIL